MLINLTIATQFYSPLKPSFTWPLSAYMILNSRIIKMYLKTWTRNTNCFTIFVHRNYRRYGQWAIQSCEYHIVPRPRKWGLTKELRVSLVKHPLAGWGGPWVVVLERGCSRKLWRCHVVDKDDIFGFWRVDRRLLVGDVERRSSQLHGPIRNNKVLV